MMEKQPSIASGWHHPKPLVKALRKAPSAAKRGESDPPPPRRVMVTTSCDNDNEEVDSSDEYVTATGRNFKR
jgi:hypothetical protein